MARGVPKPKALADLVDTRLDEYVAIFLPGDHGAMLGLSESAALGAAPDRSLQLGRASSWSPSGRVSDRL